MKNKNLSPYRHVQRHVGVLAREEGSEPKGSSLWHTDLDGLFWCGQTYHRTPEQLFDECRSTMNDLMRLYPHLKL